MRIVIATAQVPFIRGGAEILAEGLLHALRSQRHAAEIVAIPFKWYPPERILEQVVQHLAQLLGVCDRLIATLGDGRHLDRDRPRSRRGSS